MDRPNDLGPIARRIERQRAAEARAIGRPTVFSPRLSTWVERAQAGRLPVKEYGR